MKIAANKESLDALQELSQLLPGTLDRLDEATARLLRVFDSVSGLIGPHESEFEEIFHAVQRMYEQDSETIHEISCLISSVVEKLASYLNESPAVRTSVNRSVDTVRRFNAAAEQRLQLPGSNPLALKMYSLGREMIKIGDYNYSDTPRYKTESKMIFLDALADLSNPCGEMSSYFHECGHLLDHYFGAGHSWLSSDPEFHTALRNDFNRDVGNVMKDNECSESFAYDLISDAVAGVWDSEISDILGSMSGCRCQGTWGHEPKYWSKDPSLIEKEAFANMFEASIGDKEKLSSVKRWFPTAYARFEVLLKEAVE